MYDSQHLISELGARFDSTSAHGLHAVLQLELDEGDIWHMVIDDGQLDFIRGRNESPAAVLFASSETVVQLIRHELSGIQAIMSGRVRVRGDIMLVARLSRLFDKPGNGRDPG
ncbi:SCP-2 sterol transfer family protein [Kushneria sinocarnis]|uniref:SCP-2 sterol transfer family protein n=1 Tax=Kushneria sinocarnis TaxID=595502 RepID=A0A420WYE5_9GAMM|nr:SCP2 sterol-binding domain-containing protein [Kushneria sinocarnis]RKR06242.1 SCP-2 sterol transfer family protein [Kushneria sinocarnis]